MITWMLYSALVALIVAVAARAAEWLARLAGYRVRWIWAGALALTAYLSASTALRGIVPAPFPTGGSSTIEIGEAAQAHPHASWRVRIEDVRRSLDAPLRGALATVHRAVSPTANVYVASLSSVISVGLALLLVGIGLRFRSARLKWPVVIMQGVEVCVAPHIGPVVIGLVRPEIVVPRWLLARPADEQRLVVTHEDEHIRARDPLLLGLAWGAVVAAPWNPAIWYMLSRLRLAVELDCDARVLRRGATPRSYGSLLIDVAQHSSALRLSALALTDDSSHLHQRILAMKPTVPRFARLRGALAAAVSLTGVFVACQATLPTDADIAKMDVATATRTARELAKASGADTSVAYTVDGAPAAASDVSALAPSAVSRVEIVKGQSRRPAQVNIETRKPASVAAAGDSSRTLLTALMRDRTAGQVDTVPRAASLPILSNTSFTGLIFIDGVRATESQMRSLDPKQIESIEVLKGPYAAQFYKEPEAEKGVIDIKTKRR